MNGSNGQHVGITVRGLLAAVLAAAVVSVFSCGSGDNGEIALGTVDLPDQEFADFETMESDSGLTKWKLRAPVARIYNARKLLVTDSPRIEFFNEVGELASVLIADKGEFNQVTHDFIALGNVIVTSREGYKLETETLVWVNRIEEIHTEDFVKFTKGSDILTGYGFRSDPELASVEIERDVQVYLRDEEGVMREELRMDAEEEGRRHE